MDKSSEYIKMCDCFEIQDNWKQKIGDCTDNGIVVLIHSPDKTMQVRLEWNTLKHKNNLVWLPRQDQLQGMMEKDRKSVASIRSVEGKIHGIWLFLRKNPNIDITSMEQLWLAFVMHELHKKVWTGEKWEEK